MAEEANAKKPSGMSVSVSGSDGPQAHTFEARTGAVTTETAGDLAGSTQLVTSKHDREKQDNAGKEAPKEGTEGEPKAKPEGEEQRPPAETTGDLGEYDPANAESVSKFDAHYFEEGRLSLGKLTAEFDGNAKDGKDGSLNESTYKFLEDRLGVSREMANEIQTALLQQRRSTVDAFYGEVGGKESWDKMIAWGQQGGYTKDQAEAFNAALQKGGQSAVDARDALVARYSRANPNAQAKAPAVPAGRPKVTPTRDITAGAGAAAGGAAARASGEGFASQAEMDAAFKAASAIKNRGEREAALGDYYAKRGKTKLGGR